MSKKYFSIEEANSLIPVLEKEIVTLQQLQEKFHTKFKELKELKGLKDAQSKDIFTCESELEFLEIQAQVHVKNIHDTGVQLKGIDLGLLDFPAIINGEEVLLCWKLGENEVKHYHRVNEGYAGRKPLE
ncbi:DUF2203 domain-containing protein [Evansella sp. AB-P1]|uniref:DUF2203 domain-containing protein n=1 Tax=Evansella sp. AB-P1 TaxID=3037653 RepID=UPI00241D0C41|nr:DUF2203 domain-containing protein [Evansella sp. AB-P1]MDG5788432.1 DUF2203 domain-containing protein [Evansella sp. AB-P1]